MPPNEADAVNLNIQDDAAATKSLTEDVSKVKFTGGSQSTAVAIDDDESSKAANYKALTKSELMPYAADPFWIRLRWVLFISFWVIWVAMLVVSVVIIIQAPKCPPPEPKQWWQKSPIYQVYPKSFMDTNNDGKGDLKGITTKLDYLVSLGVGSVCLSSIYKSPQKDNGYDIQDFQSIDSDYGTPQDFKEMIAAMQEKGLKLIMDFVPNHSSDEHEWFQKSVKKEGEFADYYIWKKGNGGSPPNNWKSVFGGSAWEYNAERGEFYLHQFGKNQPDFNLRNPKVVEQLKKIMKYWLEEGVDGFRFVSVANMFEDENFADEVAASGDNEFSPSDYQYYNHSKTLDLAESYKLLAEFRVILDEYTEKDVANPRIMMTETYVPSFTKYYGGKNGTIAQMPLNFNFISNFRDEASVSAEKVKNTISNYLEQVPEGQWPNFVIGNHDNSRAASRFGPKLADAMNMIVMLLPGTPVTYYGEELGMQDSGLKSASEPRNPYRSPMQWDDSTNAGFSENTPWFGTKNNNFEQDNVAKESQDGVVNSHLKIYQKLAELRLGDSILFGEFDIQVGGDILAYTRIRKGNPGVLVVVNFGDTEVTTNVAEMFGADSIPEEGSVLTRSFRETTPDPENDPTANKMRVNFSEISLKPKEGIVISFVPK